MSERDPGSPALRKGPPEAVVIDVMGGSSIRVPNGLVGGTDVKRGPGLSRAERKARREQRRLERRGQP